MSPNRSRLADFLENVRYNAVLAPYSLPVFQDVALFRKTDLSILMKNE